MPRTDSQAATTAELASSADTGPPARKFLLTKEQRRFVKFGIVGGSGVLVNLATVWAAGAILLSAGVAHQRSGDIAIGIGILVSAFTNFLMNDTWTWGDRHKGGVADWFRRCAVYYVTNGTAALLQFATSLTAFRLLVVESPIFGMPPETVRPALASLIGIAVATPLNYFVNHYLTFRDKRV